jgi:starch synthase (maltosyl-transferring)
MGHALPHELRWRIMERAREIDPEFAFWGEDFDMGHRAREQGYNAVMGHLIFDLHQPEKMQAYVDWIAHEEMPITAFTAPENHNTPRAAIRDNALGFCHQALLYMVALPGMPFVQSGFELFEKQPINTGLNFTWEMMAHYDQETLPLFSEWAYKWTRQGNMVGAIRYSMHLRQEYQEILCDTNPSTIVPGSSDNPKLMVFARRKGLLTLLFVFNTTMWDNQAGEAELFARDYLAQGLWGYEGATLLSDRLAIHVDLGGGHSMMFMMQDAP